MSEKDNIPLKQVLVIVPAYNEEASLPQVLDALNRKFPEIAVVVINDGSQDTTARVAQAKGIPVINLAINLGIGGAVQTGFAYGLRQGYEVCVQLDADGQHDPADLPRLLKPIFTGEADCAIGSRFCRSGNYRSTLARRMGIRLLSCLLWLLGGKKIADVTSGYRAMNRAAYRRFAFSYPEDYPETESLLELLLDKRRVIEVPVTMHHRQGGQSSIRPCHCLVYMTKVGLALLMAVLRRRVLAPKELGRPE